MPMSEEIEVIDLNALRAAKEYRRKMGWVYLVRASNNMGPVKIGWSQTPEARLKLMHWGSPTDLTFIFKVWAPQSFETELHRRLKKYRVRGEWFNLNNRQLTSLLKFIYKRYPVG